MLLFSCKFGEDAVKCQPDFVQILSLPSLVSCKFASDNIVFTTWNRKTTMYEWIVYKNLSLQKDCTSKRESESEGGAWVE